MATNCPLCGKDAEYERRRSGNLVTCPRCGRFEIDFPFSAEHVCQWDIQDHHLLSGRARELSDRGDTLFRIVNPDECKAVASLLPRTIPEMSQKLLAAAAKRTRYFGQAVTLTGDVDYPLAYCRNSNEFSAIVRYLISECLLEDLNYSSEGCVFVVSAKGFGKLETHRRANEDSSKAFVAMSFDPALKQVFDEQIEPGILDAGYRAVRIDAKDFNGDVVAEILAEVRESRFVVSDFTGHRNGVYFETGFALGLSLPVIWLCNESDMRQAHFDTNHFNHITWCTDGSLRRRLNRRIVATIGQGPLNRPE